VRAPLHKMESVEELNEATRRILAGCLYREIISADPLSRANDYNLRKSIALVASGRLQTISRDETGPVVFNRPGRREAARRVVANQTRQTGRSRAVSEASMAVRKALKMVAIVHRLFVLKWLVNMR